MIRSSRGRLDLQADRANLRALLVECLQKRRQELAQLGGGRRTAHQQAPFTAVNRAGFHVTAQRGGNQVLDAPQAALGFAHTLLQGRQRRRRIGRLLQAEGLVAAEGGVHDRLLRGALVAVQRKGTTVHIIITDAWLARSQAMHLNGLKLLAAGALGSLLLMLGAVATYHWVFLQGVRQGWPGFESVARVVTQGDVNAQNLYMRENLDAMARRVGEMQARMLQIESLGERVAGLAGLNPADFKVVPGAGGTLVGSRSLSMDEMNQAMAQLETASGARVDWLTAV